MEKRVEAFKDALAAKQAKKHRNCHLFSPDKTALWFVQAMAKFLIQNITVSKKKYAHPMTMLNSEKPN